MYVVGAAGLESYFAKASQDKAVNLVGVVGLEPTTFRPPA